MQAVLSLRVRKFYSNSGTEAEYYWFGNVIPPYYICATFQGFYVVNLLWIWSSGAQSAILKHIDPAGSITDFIFLVFRWFAYFSYFFYAVVQSTLDYNLLERFCFLKVRNLEKYEFNFNDYKVFNRITFLTCFMMSTGLIYNNIIIISAACAMSNKNQL